MELDTCLCVCVCMVVVFVVFFVFFWERKRVGHRAHQSCEDIPVPVVHKAQEFSGCLFAFLVATQVLKALTLATMA